MFVVEDDKLVPIPCLSLTIIVGVLQLSFCFCGLPCHVVRAKKMHMDIKVHCLTVLCCFSLFHLDISVHVCEHLKENLMHQGIANLECINLVTEIGSMQAVLNHLEVQLCINNGSFGNHLLIKVQVSTISRRDGCHRCSWQPYMPIQNRKQKSAISTSNKSQNMMQHHCHWSRNNKRGLWTLSCRAKPSWKQCPKKKQTRKSDSTTWQTRDSRNWWRKHCKAMIKA